MTPVDRSDFTTTEIIDTDPRFQLVIAALGWEDVDKDGRFDIVAEIVDGLTDTQAAAADREWDRAVMLRVAALEAASRVHQRIPQAGYTTTADGTVLTSAAAYERYLRTGEYEAHR